MVFNTSTKSALLLGLLISMAASPVLADQPAAQAAAKTAEAATSYLHKALCLIPKAISYAASNASSIPGASWAYEKTVIERPEATILVGAIAAYLAYSQYTNYHDKRSEIRRQLWIKIQQECYDFTANGQSIALSVRNFQDQHIANALLAKKADWIKDAAGISRYGVFSDSRLVGLIEEFFEALQSKAANVTAPAAAPAPKPWWKVWQTQQGQRLLPAILADIEKCLMGSCTGGRS